MSKRGLTFKMVLEEMASEFQDEVGFMLHVLAVVIVIAVILGGYAVPTVLIYKAFGFWWSVGFALTAPPLAWFLLRYWQARRKILERLKWEITGDMHDTQAETETVANTSTFTVTPRGVK